jgi:1-deoxy-D-xylulose-5-phosphate synthase
LAIRYPRGRGTILNWQQPFSTLKIGKGECITEGTNIAVLTIGTIGTKLLALQQEFPKSEVAHYNMRFIKPLDEELLHGIFQKFSKIITIEEGTVIGGFGSAVLEFASENNYKNILINRLGIPDSFIEQGAVWDLYESIRLDQKHLKEIILDLL